jgi:hypothetical protein
MLSRKVDEYKSLVTGQLSDTRARFLGARPPRLHGATVRGQPAMLALSSRPWLGHVDLQGRFVLAPLSYEVRRYRLTPSNPSWNCREVSS